MELEQYKGFSIGTIVPYGLDKEMYWASFGEHVHLYIRPSGQLDNETGWGFGWAPGTMEELDVGFFETRDAVIDAIERYLKSEK